MLADLIWQNRTANSRSKNFIAPVYKFHKTFKNDLTLSLIGKYRYQNQGGSLSIYSNDSIAGAFEYFPDAGVYLTEQYQHHRISAFHNQIKIRKKFNDLELELNSGYDNNIEKLGHLSDVYDFGFPFEGRERLQFQSLANSVSLMYRRNRYSMGANLNYTLSEIDNVQDKEVKSFLLPGYFLMYKFSRKWNVSTSYTVKIFQPTLLQTNRLLRIKEQVTLQTGGVNIQEFTAREAFTLSIFKTFGVSLEGITFNSSITFSPRTREIQPFFISDGYFQTEIFTTIDRGKEWLGNISFSKTKRRWSAHFNVNASSSSTIRNDEKISDKYLLNTMRFEYKKNHNLKLNADLSMNISERRYMDSKFLNVGLMPGLHIEYSSGLFVQRLSYKIIYNEIGNISRSYHRLNIAFIRRKVLKNFEMSLLFNDLLNLRPGTISTSTFNQNFIQTSNFVSIPGQIMLGIKWYFAEKPG